MIGIPRRVVFAFFGIVALSLIGGCASDKKVIAQADTFNASLAPAEEKNAELNAYFTQVGRRVQLAAKQADAANYGCSTHFKKREDVAWMFSDKVQFHLVNSKTLNAFTTGGYHVYVYNELFQTCDNESELAAVIAHEFGHIYCRHVHKGMNRNMAIIGMEGVAGAGGYVVGGSENGAAYAKTAAGLAAQVAQYKNMGFTRDDEAQADEDGFEFYWRGGWDPRQFGAFFQRMIDLGYDKTPAEQSDHPTLASRVVAANKNVAIHSKKLDQYRQPDFATEAQFAHYKELGRQASQNMPDDQQVLQTKEMLQALPRSCWAPSDPPDRQDALQKLLDKLNAKAEAEQKSKQ
jgi:predicted Zn-dependent protease